MLIDTDVFAWLTRGHAATAIEGGLTLLTANIKHFSPIAGLTLEKFDPNPAGP